MMTLPSSLIALVSVIVLLSTSLQPAVIALSSDYYDQTCPMAESTITKVVNKAMLNDKTVPAALLRMQFHDCFVRVNFPLLCFALFTHIIFRRRGFSWTFLSQNLCGQASGKKSNFFVKKYFMKNLGCLCFWTEAEVIFLFLGEAINYSFFQEVEA